MEKEIKVLKYIILRKYMNWSLPDIYFHDFNISGNVILKFFQNILRKLIQITTNRQLKFKEFYFFHAQFLDIIMIFFPNFCINVIKNSTHEF